MNTNEILSHIDSLLKESRLNEAEKYMKATLSDAEKSDRPDIMLTLYNELAGFYRDCGRFAEALESCRCSEELLEKMNIGGAQLASALLNSANACRAAGLYDESFDYYRRIYAILENIGAEKPLYASYYNNLALLYQETNNWQEAADCLILKFCVQFGTAKAGIYKQEDSIMGMTMTQKILAAAAGLSEVKAGQLIEADLSLVLGNDITSPVAIHEMERFDKKGVFDKDKIALVLDHFVPNKDIKSAEHCKCVREFAGCNEITNFFDVGEMGIEHALLPEKGLVVAGDVVIGADSHTCTYGALGAFSTGVGSTDMAAGMATGKAWFKVPSAIKFVLTGKPAEYVTGKDVILHIIGMIGVDGALYQSMEFTGDGISYLSMDDRLCIANMAIEAGGKNGIFPVDEKTIAYMKEHSTKEYKVYEADEDAEYTATYTIDLSSLKPTVSFPHLPENTHTIDEVGDIAIDQVVIGSCTNGRIEDLRAAAEILKGRKVKKGLRCIVIPATQAIYLQAIEEGLVQTFIQAGAVVSTPTCGPCLGGYMGILAAHERCVSTTNRNFVGRMGDVTSEVYLASPYVAAASAVTGKISGPKDVL